MQYLDQPLVVGQQVRVYRNLHRGDRSEGINHWSVQARIPGKGWRVVAHSTIVVLEAATFQVSEAGRQKVLRERRKNVHAFITGRFVRFGDGPGDTPFGAAQGPAVQISYNPFKAGHFVQYDEWHREAGPASFMARVYLLEKGVWGVAEYPTRTDGAAVVFCDDPACGRHIPEAEDFWFTDWKCPSEIYCDGCGPKHGFPHPQPAPSHGGDWLPDPQPAPIEGWDVADTDCPF